MKDNCCRVFTTITLTPKTEKRGSAGDHQVATIPNAGDSLWTPNPTRRNLLIDQQSCGFSA